MGNWGEITPINEVISPYTYIYNWFSGAETISSLSFDFFPNPAGCDDVAAPIATTITKRVGTEGRERVRWGKIQGKDTTKNSHKKAQVDSVLFAKPNEIVLFLKTAK